MALQHTEQEIIVTVAPRVGKWHELAEAIRRGSLLYPQAFHRCYDRDLAGKIIGSCALGAARDGGWGRHELLPDQPEMNCPVCGRRGADKVQHLNDDHRWTRERIADWLDTL